MTNDGVTRLLRELHHKLEGTNSITEQDRALLKQLSGDIEALLGESGEAKADRHKSLLERLQTEVRRFEVTHPELTSTLAHVSKALGDMGI